MPHCYGKHTVWVLRGAYLPHWANGIQIKYFQLVREVFEFPALENYA